ncbi:MAG: DUF3618 domain-containing protein [Candidatus Rokuibacteriota bacterium]
MARSPDEIQAEIALTRRQIEQRLDALAQRVPRRWWMPYALLAGGLAAGVLLSRLPLLALVGGAARTVQTGLSVAAALATVDRVLAERRPVPAREGEPAGEQQKSHAWRRAS